MRRFFQQVALGVTVVAVAIVGYYLLSQPTKLTIAVGPPGSDDQKMVEAIAHRLQARREPIQLKILYKDGSVQSSDAIDAGKTDLAVIRGDLPKQPNAGLVLILRRDPVMILATRSSGIKKIVDLRGKKIGVIRVVTNNADLQSNNAELLKSLLAYYSIPESALSIVPMLIADLPKAVAEKQVDAVFVAAPTGETVAMKAVEAMGAGSPAGPVFVPLSEPDALILKNPRLVKDEIVRGIYGGEPPTPASNIPTISIPHSIVASNGLSDSVVADLTRSIFNMKTVLARDNKLASRIEAPSTSRDAVAPVHPGAAAYIDDEEQSFFDRYIDFFYIGSMLIGVFASGLAALFTRKSSETRASVHGYIENGLALAEVARKSQTNPEIEEIEHQADELTANIVRNTARAQFNPSDIAAFNLILGQIREALNTKRQQLAITKAPEPVAGEGDVQDLLSRASSMGKAFPRAG